MATKAPEPDLITVTAATTGPAPLIPVVKGTLYREIRAGRIPYARKIGSKVFVSVSAYREWVLHGDAA